MLLTFSPSFFLTQSHQPKMLHCNSQTHILIHEIFRSFHTNYMQSCQKLQGTQWHTTIALNVMTWHKIHTKTKNKDLREWQSKTGAGAVVCRNARQCFPQKKREIVQIQRRKKLLFILKKMSLSLKIFCRVIRRYCLLVCFVYIQGVFYPCLCSVHKTLVCCQKFQRIFRSGRNICNMIPFAKRFNLNIPFAFNGEKNRCGLMIPCVHFKRSMDANF